MGTSKLIAYLVIAGVVAAGSFALPLEAGAAVRLSIGAAAIGALVWAIVRRRPARPAGWWLIALGGTQGYAGALAVAATSGFGPNQRLATAPQIVLVIGALLTLAAGLAVLGRRSSGSGTWDALDTAITATWAFLLAWVFYIDPALVRGASSFATVVAVAVPAAALLVFGMAVKLAFGGALATWSGRVLLVAIVAVLCAAGLLIEPIGAPTVPIGLPMLAAWLAFLILLGAAGVAAGFTVVSDDGHRGEHAELPFARVWLFVLLALIAPLNVAIGFSRAGTYGPPLAAIVVPPLCGTLILLILVLRLALVARLASRRAEELGARSASLAESISRHGELERELAYRAMHDPLTGLANREVVTERMDRLRELQPETPEIMARGQALMMLDLDGFKGVNDTLGHPMGDQALVDVAQRLARTVGDTTVVTRLGGDEFAVLLENTASDEARRTAEAVRQALSAPYLIAGREVFLSASIGLLLTGPGACPPGAAEGLRNADQALYDAKQSGGNRVTEYRPRPHIEELETSRIDARLRHAIARDELVLHYQPIFGLDNNRIVAVEALVRWQPADSGMIFPSQFLPVAEQTGLIIDIGAWVLRHACRDARPWHAEHKITVSVNISLPELQDASFTDRIRRTLADTSLPGEALMLEFAQRTLAQTATHPPVRAHLEDLRTSGIRIAVDDFVAGSSSWSAIPELPVDLVKFDCPPQHARAPAPGSQTNWTTLSATLQLISHRTLSAVAVGIETDDQAITLRRLDCPYGQGYYFAPPVPADQIDGLLHRQPALHHR